MSTNESMHISGSGTIPAGEYDKVSISGSGRLSGRVRCSSFSTSGSSKGESIECSEDFKVSGSAHFSESIKASKIKASGSLSCDGELCADKEISCSGSTKCKKSVKSDQISIAGAMSVGGDVEAESVKVSGIINCGGLLNAEDIEIKFDRGMEIGSIGGSKIVILSERSNKIPKWLPLFSSIAKSNARTVSVATSIEGDEIALECVTCPRVTGRIVAIGQGCDIDLVQYGEQIEISPDAKVGRSEKI